MSKTGIPIKLYCLNLRCGYIREDANRILYRRHRVEKPADRYDPNIINTQKVILQHCGK